MQNVLEFLTDKEVSVIATNIMNFTLNALIAMTLKKPTKKQSTMIRRRTQSWNVV